MTEENVAQKEQVEYTEKQQEAMSKGWNPDKETVIASGKDWVDAEEFLAREPFFKEIHGLKKQIKTQSKQFEALQEHLAAIRASRAEDKISSLQEKKKSAVEVGDVEAVSAIDKEIDKVRDEKTKAAAPATQGNAAFEAFQEENSWYGEDKDMTEYAEFIGERMAKSGKYKTYEELYADIAKKVVERFPGEKESKREASPVEGGNSRSATAKAGSKKKYSAKDVPEEYRAIMKRLTSGPTKIMTEDQYIEDLVKAGFLN